MRGSWAKFAQLGFTLALLLIISDAARVSGGPASDDAAAPVPVATPTPELTATPTVTPTSTAGPTARPRATPPPDPRPIGAIDEDPPVRTTDEWVPVARPRLEPEVAGLTVTAPSSPTPAPTPAVATPTPTSTVAPAPIATATPTATAAPVVSAALPPPTPTPSPVPTAPPNSASTQGQQALDLIAYPWEASLPGWTIDFLDERSGLRGLTFTGEHRIEVYVRPGDSTWDIARVVAHEIGHAVDLMHNTTTERASWLEHRGIPDAAWWPGSAASDFESGAGDFAECFATWQVGSGSLAIGGGCDQSDIDLVAALS